MGVQVGLSPSGFFLVALDYSDVMAVFRNPIGDVTADLTGSGDYYSHNNFFSSKRCWRQKSIFTPENAVLVSESTFHNPFDAGVQKTSFLSAKHITTFAGNPISLHGRPFYMISVI